MKLKLVSIFAVSALLLGCSTVTVRPIDGPKLANVPTYEETKPFYMWGLVGEHRVDVTEVCSSGSPKQMQTQQTFANGVLGVLTLGIYAPHTVKVWCE